MKKALIAGCTISIFAVGACKDEDASAPTAGAHETKIACVYCKAEGTLFLPSVVEEESWPKKCPSCKRSGAFPCGECKQCGGAVALMDTRTWRLGTPEVCPHCGKPWQK